MLAPIQKLLRKAADPGSRRGTVLLLVLGSLALVLILAVVYAALGKGDRRTARTTQERKSAVDNIEAIADHIAGVFATDVFNVVFIRFSQSGAALFEAPNNQNLSSKK